LIDTVGNLFVDSEDKIERLPDILTQPSVSREMRVIKRKADFFKNFIYGEQYCIYPPHGLIVMRKKILRILEKFLF